MGEREDASRLPTVLAVQQSCLRTAVVVDNCCMNEDELRVLTNGQVCGHESFPDAVVKVDVLVRAPR